MLPLIKSNFQFLFYNLELISFDSLVTHNSNKRGIALKFSWTPPNNIYDEIDDTKVSPRIRNSAIRICVLDHSCRNMRDRFENKFIDQLIHITNDYLINTDRDSFVSKNSGKKTNIFFFFLSEKRILIQCKLLNL
jgi:hypothetical protein